MHTIYGLRPAEQMHLGRWHVHGSSQDGMVLYTVQSLCLLAFFFMSNVLL